MSQTKNDSAGVSDSRPGMRGEDNPYQEKKEATNQEKVRSLASKNLSLRFVQTGAREEDGGCGIACIWPHCTPYGADDVCTRGGRR